MTDPQIDEADLDAALAFLDKNESAAEHAYEFVPQVGAEDEPAPEPEAQPEPEKPASTMPRLLTYSETCELLGISKPTLYSLIREGALKPVSFGERSKRFDEGDLHIYAKRAAGMTEAEANDPATPSPLDGELLTSEEAAAVLRISSFTFRALIAAGEITPVKLAVRTHRFQGADIAALSRSGINTEAE